MHSNIECFIQNKEVHQEYFASIIHDDLPIISDFRNCKLGTFINMLREYPCRHNPAYHYTIAIMLCSQIRFTVHYLYGVKIFTVVFQRANYIKRSGQSQHSFQVAIFCIALLQLLWLTFLAAMMFGKEDVRKV